MQKKMLFTNELFTIFFFFSLSYAYAQTGRLDAIEFKRKQLCI